MSQAAVAFPGEQFRIRILRPAHAATSLEAVFTPKAFPAAWPTVEEMPDGLCLHSMHGAALLADGAAAGETAEKVTWVFGGSWGGFVGVELVLGVLGFGVAAQGLLPQESLRGGVDDGGPNPAGDEHKVPYVVVVALGGDGGEEGVCAEDFLQGVLGAVG